MKNFIKVTALVLCLAMLMPTGIFGYAGSVTQNPAVTMPKGTPALDGSIETTGVWSEPAELNDATFGRFWGLNAPTSTAKVYFAYDDGGLYFAADINDHSIANSFVATTGYDDINNSGSSRPYGWNGDVLTLMLDPLGVFEQNTSKQTTPWYNVGIMADNTVKVYRSQVNEKDITSSVTAKGKVTDTGWCFELYIPWSIITADVSSLGLSATQTKLATIGSVSRAACMYMDRYRTSGGVDTWGRFITVCESTYDGYNGCHTNGISAKAYGIVLNHADAGHIWGEWQITKEPTCTMMGLKTKYCSHCTQIQTQAIMATGHSAGEPVITDVTCTEDGSVITYCTKCNAVLSEESAPAQGHVMSDWEIVTDATDTENGLKRKVCANCDYTEEEVIPALKVPYVSTSNYVMNITLADEIKDIRFALGRYTKPADIKAAEGNVAVDNATLVKGTVDGIYSYELQSEGEYTVWIRMKDGKEYFIPFDVADIKPYLSAYGVKITLNDIPGDIKDFFIAEGELDSYNEIKANGYIVNVTSVKIAGKHDYTYTVQKDGMHTVLVRYNDGTSEALHIDLTVDKPVFTPNGLQVIISNIPDLKVIRTAYGTYDTPGDTKRAEGARNFSDKSVVKGQDPYTIQYREEGEVTIIVEYNNGYVEAYHYDVKCKKPTLAKSAGKLTFTNLDGLVNLRYAEGRYTTSAEIKRAEGSVTLKASDIDENGNIVITGLKAGIYSFCVQYDDDSYNYYVIPMEDAFADSVEIGSGRRMLWEDGIINEGESSYSIVNGDYVKKEIVFTFNKAYETGGIVFPNIVEMPDGTYRMYYTGFSDRRRVCYLTSTDGLTWKRANLRSNTYTGESYTNIVTSELVSPSALYVFYDKNPNATEKIKGIYGQWGDGLFLEHTKNNGDYFDFWPDETKMMGSPAETEGCFFDTLNTVFWDEQRGQYVAFVRGFHEGDNYNLSRDYVEYNPTNLVRDTRVAYSDDCINWTIPQPIKYNDGVDHQMYANAITQYERSEGLYIGMPTRFILDSNGEKWTDTFFMSSRDLLNWNRSQSPILAPAEGQMYVYPDCGYPTAGMIQTSENEISFYMDEYDSSKKCDVLYRYTVRTDGFMAAEGSKIVTKPLLKEGNSLELNFNGQVKVTMTDASGNSVTSGWMDGDEIAKTVTFDGTLASDNVILTFEMKNAELYSFKFN